MARTPGRTNTSPTRNLRHPWRNGHRQRASPDARLRKHVIAARIVTVEPIRHPYYFGPAARTFLYKRITRPTAKLVEEKRQSFFDGKALQAAGRPTRRGTSPHEPEYFSPLDRIASFGFIVRRRARFLHEPICPTARGPLAGSPARCRRSTAPRRELPPILSLRLVTANSIQACERTQCPSSRPVRRFYKSKAALVPPVCPRMSRAHRRWTCCLPSPTRSRERNNPSRC